MDRPVIKPLARAAESSQAFSGWRVFVKHVTASCACCVTCVHFHNLALSCCPEGCRSAAMRSNRIERSIREDDAPPCCVAYCSGPTTLWLDELRAQAAELRSATPPTHVLLRDVLLRKARTRA